MIRFLLIPFFIQAIAIGIDEFYFHHQRGLPKWERIGHPIDTLSTLFCLIFVLLFPYNQINLYIYCSISLISCLLVTKDEWIHRKHCRGPEQWLHAILFLNHSLMLVCLAFLWQSGSFQFFLWMQFVLTLVFCLYQAFYWNLIYVQKKDHQ